MRSLLTLPCTILLLQGCVGMSHQAADEGAVAKAIRCFPDSWNRRDMTAFGQCFAMDADFVNVTTQWWRGRASIEKNHAFLLGTIDKSDTAGITVPAQAYGIFSATTLTFKSTELRYPRADVGIARISWQITGDARTPQVRSGLLMFVLTNTGGRWEIVAVQNTEMARPVK
jgi:uncharacterized protein (TIGR02246 family)